MTKDNYTLTQEQKIQQKLKEKQEREYVESGWVLIKDGEIDYVPPPYTVFGKENVGKIPIGDENGLVKFVDYNSGGGASSLKVLEITTSRTDNQYTIPVPNVSVDNYNFILDCYKNNKEVLIKWICPDCTANSPIYFIPNQVSTIGNNYFTTIRTTANGNHILKYQLVNGVVGYELIRIKEAITTESNFQYTQLHLEQSNQTKKIYKLNKDLEITNEYGTFKCSDLFEVSGMYFNFLSKYYHPKQSGNSLYNIFQEDQFNEKIGVINVADSDYQISGVLDLSLTYHDLFIEVSTWDSDCICVIYEGDIVKSVTRSDQSISGVSNLYFKDKNDIQQLLLTTNYNFSTVNGQSLLTGSNISAGLKEIDYVSIANFFSLVLEPFSNMTPHNPNLVINNNSIMYNLCFVSESGVTTGTKTNGYYELMYVKKNLVTNNNINYSIIVNENTYQCFTGSVLTTNNEVIPVDFRLQNNSASTSFLSVWINWNSNLNNKTIYKLILPLNIYLIEG